MLEKNSLLDSVQKFYVRRVVNGLTNKQQKVVLFAVVVFILLFVLYVSSLRAPADFPEGKTVVLEEGATLSEIAIQLERDNVVRSAFWLKNIVIVGGEEAVIAGDYFFDTKKNVFKIARAITAGDFDVAPISIRIPEGATNNDMALIFAKHLDNFDPETFLTLVNGKEGYLFPDTYFFLTKTKADEVARVLEKTFFRRIANIRQDILRFGASLDDVVIMASLLEKEARTTETRRIIAGILWKRIEIGMPLQVDAVFGYINGKGSFQLTLDDLDIDSPYNTYRYKGLPVGPISNPGLDALLAAVTPTESEYLYFLSDKSGTMHYSETFEEHKRKKQLYLQ